MPGTERDTGMQLTSTNNVPPIGVLFLLWSIVCLQWHRQESMFACWNKQYFHKANIHGGLWQIESFPSSITSYLLGPQQNDQDVSWEVIYY